MFGYVYTSTETPPRVEAPQPFMPAPASTKRRSNKNETMALLYFFACVALFIVSIVTGQCANIPWGIPDDGEETR